MADESIWRKEISFVRKSEEQAPEPDEPETPFWKTEISFARRTKRDDGAEETAAPEAEAPMDHASPVPGTLPETGPEEPGAEPAAVIELPVAAAPVESQPDTDEKEPIHEYEPTGLVEPDPESAPVVELTVAAAPVEPEPETDEEDPVHEDESTSTRALTLGQDEESEAPTDHGSDPGTDPEEPAEEEPVWMRAVTFGSKADAQAPTDDEAGVEPALVAEAPVAAAPVESGLRVSIDDSSPVQGTVPGAGLDEPGPAPESAPEDRSTDTWSTLPWLPQELAPQTGSESEPAPLRASKRRSVPLLVAGCTGLVVVALLGALFVIGSGKIASAKRNVSDLNRQIEALAPPSADRQQSPDEQRARVTALTTALASRVSWDRVFRDVSLALPKDVRLTSLTGGTAPPKFTIRGRTPWYQSLDRLVAGLRDEADLRNVQLVSSTRSKVGTRQVLEFTIAADIASPTEGGS